MGGWEYLSTYLSISPSLCQDLPPLLPMLSTRPPRVSSALHTVHDDVPVRRFWFNRYRDFRHDQTIPCLTSLVLRCRCRCPRRDQEMEDEKSFKDKQLKSAEATMRRLHQDKEKRLQEMEKVKTLDEKVRVWVRVFLRRRAWTALPRWSDPDVGESTKRGRKNDVVLVLARTSYWGGGVADRCSICRGGVRCGCENEVRKWKLAMYLSAQPLTMLRSCLGAAHSRPVLILMRSKSMPMSFL